jgi:DNA polymerase-3 subunit delta
LYGQTDKYPAAVIGVNPYFLKEYDVALKNYPMKR